MMTIYRGSPMTPTRRALLAIGVGTVALSLVLSIAPALAKNPNAGTVKIHDGTTGQDQSNDPHVCSFWVEFEGAETPETGSWELWSWPPDAKVLVTSGDYSTGPGGQSATEVLTPPVGHYRFEWQSDEASNADFKTLWVDDCTVTPDAGTATPTPTPTPSKSPSTQPSEDPAQTEPSSTPEGEVLSGNPEGTPPSLPNTSTGFETSGLLAALGILLIVGAHAHTRRSGEPGRV